MPDTIRVLVVDDSALMRTLITEMLSAADGIEVVGTAKTGLEAITKAQKLAPDVVTLDVEMPELGGIEALRHIMRKTNSKVIMLSGISSADVTYEALASGAIDFIAKPSGTFSPDIGKVSGELIEKIRVASSVEATQLRVKRITRARRPEPPRATAKNGAAIAVIIGSSTGGPAAVERVLSDLPPDIPAACLVVQHLPVGFSDSFARRLGRFSQLDVRQGGAGDKVQPGVAYVAPAGQHMTVVERPTMGAVIRLDSSPPISGLRPAADRTMESAANVYGQDAIGVLLTGMGSDGALGMVQIKRQGGYNIAQDEQTCVVYGMPRAAVERGVVDRVVPLQDIAAEIRKAVATRKRRERDGR